MAARHVRPLVILLGLGGRLALGLVNVAPITRCASAPWTVPRCKEGSPLFSSADAAKSSGEAATSVPPGIHHSNNNNGVPVREGIWRPPSQNVAQRRGNVFSIQQPQDLLDFVIEDERLSVVKVYASWCKTCKKFDLRYRKLATHYGDKHEDRNGSQITRSGRARFAEMQYDNPQNEELCKLLNATKLPYILMYKGSKGMVKEFQCGPAKFQMLIDAVNELADPAEDVGESVADAMLDFAATPSVNENATTTATGQGLPSGGEDTIESLKEQLLILESEKVEMFERMKAQIEHDKVYIQKLEAGVETQRLMLEAKDAEIANLNATLSEEKAMLQSKAKELEALSISLTQQEKETQRAEIDIASSKSQIAQLTNRMLELSFNQKAAKESERQMLQHIQELEQQTQLYERERNSLRKLFMLAVKRIGGGARGLLSRARQKISG